VFDCSEIPDESVRDNSIVQNGGSGEARNVSGTKRTAVCIGALIVGGCGAAPAVPGRSDADFDVALTGPDAASDGSSAGTGDGFGGAPGGGGVGGTAGAADCFDLSRAPAGRYDFRVAGSGFDAYDGETVRAVVVNTNRTGHGLGQTTIRNGSFEIVLPKTNEPYTGYGVYIDLGADSACTLNVDPFFQMTSGGVYQDVNWKINPQTRYLQGLPPCNIDGIFDLTQPLPCASGDGGSAGSVDASPEADMDARDAADAVADDADAVSANGDATDTGDSRGDSTDAGDALRELRPVHVVTPAGGGMRGNDIRFLGSGLVDFEGRAVLVRVDYPDAIHVHGWGEARIVGGAFDLLLPGALVQNYNPKAVVIDVNDDGQCEPGEPGIFAVNPIGGPATMLVTPAVLMPNVGCTYVNSFPRF
jgi:hypothetical protein